LDAISKTQNQIKFAYAAFFGTSLKFWKAAHIIGFCVAIDLALFGSALRFLGSSWFVPGIFFALSLGLLFLWRPRQLAQSGVQPA
jgi:hypothetical protein